MTTFMYHGCHNVLSMIIIFKTEELERKMITKEIMLLKGFLLQFVACLMFQLVLDILVQYCVMTFFFVGVIVT